MRTRADWRLKDYTGRIRAEVRDVEARQAAPCFLALVNACFGTGASVAHPQIEVRRRTGADRSWRRLSAEDRRRFWAKGRATEVPRHEEAPA